MILSRATASLVRTFLTIVVLLLPSMVFADGEILEHDLNEEIVKVPMAIQGFWGTKEIELTATTYRPPGKGPFPVILLSHGRAATEPDRLKIGRYRKIPQIREFIKRGFLVIVPIRRGYGTTGGISEENTGSCSSPFYYEAGLEAAKDIVATIDRVQKLTYADAINIVLVGQSVGGFASLVAASLNPVGVRGVVNFSGGHGGRHITHPGFPCSPEKMAKDIAKIAKTIRVPALWHYAENDSYFAPRYVKTWFMAYEEAGAKGKLVIQPPFEKDGHTLFSSRNGIRIWTVEFDKFLAENHLESPWAQPMKTEKSDNKADLLLK